MSKVKKNDWIAINLNMPENGTLADLAGYGVTPENTSIQDEDYYKTIPKVINNDLFKDTSGNFDDTKFHQFYQSALRSFNDYENSNFIDEILNSIESSPYDTFSLGDGRIISQDTAVIHNSKDPYRTTMGLGNIFEVGNPVFDAREVAQANNARDENGNILDWTPNDKGGFLKGLFRPTMALATYDEDGYYNENGIQVFHHKGEYKLDENTGDPYYEIIKNKDNYGKETLHYWDTITKDDSEWNKIDFLDSDGLTKSVGGVVARTAFTLLPYFIPNVGPFLGYLGATVALGQSLPVLSKSIDSMLTGTDDNEFGKTMRGIENWFDRFKRSQSRDVRGKFWSFENIGDIIGTSAGQLFQQRNIANLSREIFKNTLSPQTNVKLGQQLSLGYMAITSGEDSYRIAKEAGANDAVAGIMTLGTMGAYYGLFSVNHFKKYLFTNTYMDENIAMAQTMRELQAKELPEHFKKFNEVFKNNKNLSEFQRRLEHIKLFKTVKDWTTKQLKNIGDNNARMTERMASAANNGNGIGFKQRFGMYLTRSANESFEETLEETILDVGKGVTLGLQSMGVDVTEQGSNLDFGLTWRDVFSRYTSAAIGGAIGGAIFESFNHWEGGPYDSLLEKSLDERLTWYLRNGYEDMLNERIELLRKRGKLGNKSLSAKPLRTESIDGKNIVVFGSGDEVDNQNEAVYNLIKTRIENLKTMLNEQQLWTSDNELFANMLQKIREKRKDSDSEDLGTKLYHFLEDVDKAKALTITQKEFLDIVSKDANELIFNIVEKASEIEAYKNKLRDDNHITDSSRSKEDEIFKNSQKLKVLEKELKDYKDEYDQIVNGERNGYYIGWAFMRTNPKYIGYYTSLDGIENAKAPFPKTEVQNYAKYRTGLEYNDIVDKDLKEKIDSDYSSFLALQGDKRDKAIYNMHIKFSEDFASDIMAINKKYKGWNLVNSSDFLLDFYQDEINSSTDDAEKFLLQDAINKYKAAVEQHTKIEDVEERIKLLSADITRLMFGYFSSGYDEETKSVNDFIATRGINLLNKLLKKAVDNKSSLLLNINSLRKFIMENVFTESFKKDRIDRLSKSYKKSAENIELKLGELESEGNEALYDYAKNILGFTDSDFEESEIIKDDQNIEDIDSYRMRELIWNQVQDKYNILAEGNYFDILKSKINNLQDAIVNNDVNVDTLFRDLIDFAKQNGIFIDESGNLIDTEKILTDIIGPVGIDLVQQTKEWQVLTDQILHSPVVELLQKFDVYSGGKAYNVIKLIESEEAFREAQGLDKYRYRKENTREQLQTALSFLNVVTAVLDSSFDGMNEYINLSQEKQLAVTDDNLKDLYDNNITTLKNRITDLINLADRNQKQTVIAQQLTDINTKVERVKILTGIGKITFSKDDFIDFDSIWSDIGYALSSASIASDEAVKFNDAYDKFETAIHDKLTSIFNNYKDKPGDFVDAVLHGFSEEVGLYLQNPGEIGPNPILTPYNNINYLIRLTVQDPNEMKSLWTTVTDNNPQLISLFGQELVVSEMIATYEDSIYGSKLYNILHHKIHENLKELIKTHPEWTYDKDYTESKTVADNFANIDGGAGVGKTGGCDYLALEILKLKYGELHPVAIAPTEDAKTNLMFALDKDGKVLNYTVTDLINFLTDDNKIFHFNSAQDDLDNPNFVNKDKNGKTIADIPAERIEKVLGKGIKALFILDESGMINKKTMQFFLELAKAHNLFIFASGDRLQNQAIVKEHTSGIEDMVYHRLPSLTVSMRAEYNGMAVNTDRIREQLKKIQDSEYEKDAMAKEEYNDKYEEVFRDITNITLIYSDDNYAGTQKINSDAVDATIEKLITLVQQQKELDPDGKHQIAIVVDNLSKSKYDKYQDNELFKILTPRDIQGKEFDYVLIDTVQDENKYYALKNFYTMMTRSKIGSVFVDSDNRLSELKIIFEKNELASLPVLGGDAESKRALFKEYIEWKKLLSSHYPKYTRKTEKTDDSGTKEGVSSKGGGKDTSEEGVEDKAVDYELYGQEEASEEELKTLEELRSDKKKRDAYYIDKVLKGELGTQYDQQRLLVRSEKTGQKFIDFDIFKDELKDLSNNKFEEFPAALSTSTAEEPKLYHRAIIATIARAILNNTPDKRADYISSASNVLSIYAGKAGIDRKFIIDLQNSFGEDGTGIFMNDNGYMFYGFKSNDTEYLIPIYRSNINQRVYYKKDLSFKTEIGDIKITTGGEMRLSLDEVFNPIDGLVRDKDGNIQIAILTETQELQNWMRRNEQGRFNPKIKPLYDFFEGSIGKSFIATTEASPIWREFENTFSILKSKDKRIINGVNKVYDSSDYSQPFETLVLQKQISFKTWYNFVGVLRRLSDNGVSESDANGYERINRFFNLEGDHKIESVFGNRTNSQTINNADRFRELGRYKILQQNSLSGLASALFRYMQTLPDGNSLKERFFQNFAGWLGEHPNNDGTAIHHKGIVVKIVTKDNNVKIGHNFRIIPINNGSGFKVDYINPKTNISTTVYSASESKLSTIFDGLNYNFNKIPTRIFDLIKGQLESKVQLLEKQDTKSETEINELNTLKNILSLIGTVTENPEEAFKKSQLQVFPVDYYVGKVKDEDGIERQYIKYYPPYEREFWGWLTFGQDGSPSKNNDIDFEEIERFLKNDSEFKHGLYAGIKVDYSTDSNEEWKTSEDIVTSARANEYSVDITKVIAPMYSIKSFTEIEMDSKDFNDLEMRFFNKISKSNPLEGNNSAISGDDSTISMNEKGEIIFDTPVLVNAAWLIALGVDDVDNGTYELISFDLLTEQFKYKKVGENENEIESTIIDMGHIPENIKPFYKSYVFRGKNDKGQSVKLQWLNKKNLTVKFVIKTDNAEMSYFGKVTDWNNKGLCLIIDKDNNWHEIQLNTDVLPKKSRGGEYLGYFVDSDKNFAITLNGDNVIFNAHIFGEAPTSMSINSLEGAADGTMYAVALEKIHNLRNESKQNLDTAVKTETIGGFNFVFNENSIPATDLNLHSDESIPSGNWTLFAYSKNILYLYKDNDLSTLIEVSMDDINPFVNNISSSVKLQSELSNLLGLDPSIISQIIKDSIVDNPKQILDKIIENINKYFEQDFMQLDSDLTELKELSFMNNEFTISTKSDNDIEFKKLIYKALKSEYGESFNVDDIIEFTNENNDRRKLTVRYQINGEDVERTYIKENNGVNELVAPAQPDSIDSDYEKFKESVYSRKAKLDESNDEILDEETAMQRANENNLLSEQIATLEQVDKYAEDLKRGKAWSTERIKVLSNMVTKLNSPVVKNYMLKLLMNC